jgi:antitoxin VapB
MSGRGPITVHKAETFKNRNSEAVRLPKALGFGPGTPVTIERSGNTLTIRPVADRTHDEAEPDRVLAAMLVIGAPPDGVQPRPPFEWIDGPGAMNYHTASPRA